MAPSAFGWQGRGFFSVPRCVSRGYPTSKDSMPPRTPPRPLSPGSATPRAGIPEPVGCRFGARCGARWSAGPRSVERRDPSGARWAASAKGTSIGSMDHDLQALSTAGWRGFGGRRRGVDAVQRSRESARLVPPPETEKEKEPEPVCFTSFSAPARGYVTAINGNSIIGKRRDTWVQALRKRIKTISPSRRVSRLHDRR